MQLLQIDEIHRDRLVVCLRKDDPLASKAVLQPTDLQKNLSILYHPQRHPTAHTRLLELLRGKGVNLGEYYRASHSSEIQTLVKDGYGVALIRQGTVLDSDLTTRPIAGVDWTVDTVVIYHRERHPKTMPVLVRKFKRQLRKNEKLAIATNLRPSSKPSEGESTQLSLLS